MIVTTMTPKTLLFMTIARSDPGTMELSRNQAPTVRMLVSTSAVTLVMRPSVYSIL